MKYYITRKNVHERYVGHKFLILVAHRTDALHTYTYSEHGSGAFGAPYPCVVGQTLDRKSRLCPSFVQYMSKLCPNPVKVQILSSPCPMISAHVQTLLNVCQDPVQ